LSKIFQRKDLSKSSRVKYCEYKVSKMSTVNASCPLVPKLKDYIFTEKLGSGTYGDVYKVKYKIQLHILVFKSSIITNSNHSITGLLLQDLSSLRSALASLDWLVKKRLKSIFFHTKHSYLARIITICHLTSSPDFKWSVILRFAAI
jgi:hypothetical protein